MDIFAPLPTQWPDRPVVRPPRPIKAPRAPGVYTLELPSGLYIGSSRNLLRRLQCWQSKLGDLPKFRYIVTEDFRYQEQRLIERCQRRGIRIANSYRAIQKKLFRRSD